MAILDAVVETRFRIAVRSLDLHFRNWSAPDAWVFAIYRSDGYLGAVTLRPLDGGWVMSIERPDRCARAQREILEALVLRFGVG